MQKQAPTLPRLLVMAGFALSCFGLILFLWVAFGGPVPFAAKGYQVKVDFINAGQLASQADVRISGVPVGKVAKVELGPRNATTATLQIDPKYAPIPSDSRAILRTKTLLGETYVELTPGNRASGTPLADGAMLPARQVRQQVTIDRIFQLFDEPTRKGFQEWQQGLAGALAGRGGDISDAFGNLPAFTESADRTLTVLNSEGDALKRLVRDTGVVFNAISERGDELRQSIRNSNIVFSTTGRLNKQLADIFTVLPTFESESTKTLNQLKALSASGTPLMNDQLIPAARQISPTLEGVARLARPLNTVMTNLEPAVNSSEKGVPALTKFLNGNGSQPGLSAVLGGPDSLYTFLNQLNPMLAMLGVYKNAIPSLFANATAATQAADNQPTDFSNTGVHYLRATTTFNPLSLAAYPQRPNSSRTSPYFSPDSSLSGAGNGSTPPITPSTFQLKSYLTDHCSSSIEPKAPTSASAPDKPDPFTTGANGTTASPDITLTTSDNVLDKFGNGSDVSGPGIAPGTKVVSIRADVRPQQVKLSINPTANLSATNITFLWNPNPWLQQAIQAMAFSLPGGKTPQPACDAQSTVPAPATPTLNGHEFFAPFSDYSGLFPKIAAQGNPTL